VVYAMKLKIHLAQLILSGEYIDFACLHTLGYGGDANKIIARLKRETVELQSKEKELENIKGQKEGAIKESDFDDWIISVGKYLGYGIKRKEMVLSEFLAANKAMNREIEIKNKAFKRVNR
jgi:hypothetical protein